MTKPLHFKAIADGQQRAAGPLGDELLAKLVGRGSGYAFTVLCERHGQALYRYCLSILRNEHDAQDALQSTMTQAYVALRTRERDVSLRAWLFRIAHNESVTILRKRIRQTETGLTSATQTGDPHDVLEDRARLSQLVADLRGLPERQRATLIMRELSGLGVPEIAKALGISAAATKQALYEARNSLRDLDRGRAMECEEVRSAISMDDRRILRGRRISAHLSACESCQGYRSAIGVREADLRALLPTGPIHAIGATLARALGFVRWTERNGTAGAPAGSSPGLLTHASASALFKLGTSVAVIAAGAAGAVHIGHVHVTTTAADKPASIATEPPAKVRRERGTHSAVASVAADRTGSRRQTARPATGVQPLVRTRLAIRGVSPPPAQAQARASGADAHAAPTNEQAISRPVGRSAGAEASSGDSALAAQRKRRGGEGHGKGGGESANSGWGPRQAPAERQAHGDGQEEDERSPQEYRSAGSGDEAGDGKGSSGREKAHEQGGGNGHSEQSGE